MIDPLREELLSPAQACKLYPLGASGRPPSVSLVYRHIQKGFKGIRLESIRVPRIATSREAVSRFFRRLTEATTPEVQDVVSRGIVARSDQQVERELDHLGL